MVNSVSQTNPFLPPQSNLALEFKLVNWLTDDATVLVYKSTVNSPESSPGCAMIEHSKFKTVSGVGG